jgi:hypothetical protein
MYRTALGLAALLSILGGCSLALRVSILNETSSRVELSGSWEGEANPGEILRLPYYPTEPDNYSIVLIIDKCRYTYAMPRDLAAYPRLSDRWYDGMRLQLLADKRLYIVPARYVGWMSDVDVADVQFGAFPISPDLVRCPPE